jgi:hypothetical protein
MNMIPKTAAILDIFHVLSAGFYLMAPSIAYFEFANGKLDFFD